jgi:hypothetical protein
MRGKPIAVAMTLAILCGSTSPASGDPGPISIAIEEFGRQPMLSLSASRAQGGGRRPCGQKMLIGLGVGAGVGATIGGMAWKSVDQPAAVLAASTGVLGLMGLAVGYKLCR